MAWTIYSDSTGKIELDDDGTAYLYTSSDGGNTWAATGSHVSSGSGNAHVTGTAYNWGNDRTSGQFGLGAIRYGVPTAPIVIASVALSVAVTEGIDLKDNKFDRTVCVTASPLDVNDGAKVDSEIWEPKIGLPSTMTHDAATEGTVLEVSNFGFNIPEDAVIRGITVEVDRTVLGSGAGFVSADEAELFLTKWFEDLALQISMVGIISGKNASYSGDGGATWSNNSTGHTNLVTWVTSNADASVLLTHNGSPATAGPTNTGLFRSTDQGQTWTKIDPSGTCPTTENDNDDGGVWFVNGKFYLVDVSDYMWSSTDGITWTKAGSTTGHVASATDPYYHMHYWSAASRYYLFVDDATTGIYTSTDGLTWSAATAAPVRLNGTELGAHDHLASDGTYLYMVTRSGAAVDSELQRTSDTDADPGSWSANLLGAYGKVRSLEANSNVVIIGLYGGVIRRSTDNGTTWSGTIELDSTGTASETRVLQLKYDSANSTWYGLQRNGKLFSSTDDGLTWSQVGVTNTVLTSTFDFVTVPA